jgi:hypothetical protein
LDALRNGRERNVSSQVLGFVLLKALHVSISRFFDAKRIQRNGANLYEPSIKRLFIIN